jgi:hypothetical protein
MISPKEVDVVATKKRQRDLGTPVSQARLNSPGTLGPRNDSQSG